MFKKRSKDNFLGEPSNILLLLGKSATKSAGIKSDLQNDTTIMWGNRSSGG